MNITGFQHKGLAALYNSGKVTKGMDPKAAKKLPTQLAAIASATHPNELRGMWDTHELSPKHPGYWAMDVIGAWRLTFFFDGTNGTAAKFNYIEYHGSTHYHL